MIVEIEYLSLFIIIHIPWLISMYVGKIFAGNQSAKFNSKSQAVSKKVLVPDNVDDGASLVTDDALQGPSSVSQAPQVDISSLPL